MADDSQRLLTGSTTRAATIRRWITGTFTGRALALGALIKLLAFLLALAPAASAAAKVIDTIGDIGLVGGAAVLVYRLFLDMRRQLLWRVRRKLTISYIFIGFVPVLLIITFFGLCGWLLLTYLSAQLINTRIQRLTDEAGLLAEVVAADVAAATTPADVERRLASRQRSVAARYPGASYALLPAVTTCGERPPDDRAAPMTAGPWAHAVTPAQLPAWVPCEGYSGIMIYTIEDRRVGDWRPGRLLARAVAWPPSGPARGRAVLVDVPINEQVAERFRRDTGVRLEEMGVVATPGNLLVGASGPTARPEADRARGPAPPSDERGLLGYPVSWLAFVTVTDWEQGEVHQFGIPIRSSVVGMYEQLVPVQGVVSARVPAPANTVGELILMVLAAVAGLLLLILGAAFLMGLGLARSITGAIHELFVGTERVRRGDFRHKIAVHSRDQLGELAASFNSMTASIEDLLRQKAEKERLEQELRIARAIQMSLLPQNTRMLPGIGLVAHCEPAREVGGDYYDFLPIDATRLGILIADVAGKGTSAALYMAELKGIVLTLSQRRLSPRQLLIDANHIISRHLDSRSFITVTYVLVDLQARTLQYARAGHCPMIYVPGPYAASRAPQILAPDGMVLGLAIDDGTMFNRLLDEVTLPLGSGDLFLLYTDGMSEAMNPGGDCFGDDRLAAVVREHADLPSDVLLARILEQVTGFAGSTVQQDDMTMVLIRVEEAGAVAAVAATL